MRTFPCIHDDGSASLRIKDAVHFGLACDVSVDHPAFTLTNDWRGARRTGMSLAVAAVLVVIVSTRAYGGVIVNCASDASNESTLNHVSYTGIAPGSGSVPAGGDYVSDSTVAIAPYACKSGASGVTLSEKEVNSSRSPTQAYLTLGSNRATGTVAGSIALYGPAGVEISGALSVDDAATFKSGIDMSGTGITGLQAGTLSATSTDAVNGSQLFSVSSALSTTRSDLA
ncbi:hypothetical protein ACS0X6_38145, partial [Burkholderia gladioli]